MGIGRHRDNSLTEPPIRIGNLSESVGREAVREGLTCFGPHVVDNAHLIPVTRSSAERALIQMD